MKSRYLEVAFLFVLLFALGLVMFSLVARADNPYHFNALEQRWICEARQGKLSIDMECRGEWCTMSAGGLWIAEVRPRDAKRAMQAVSHMQHCEAILNDQAVMRGQEALNPTWNTWAQLIARWSMRQAFLEEDGAIAPIGGVQ